MPALGSVRADRLRDDLPGAVLLRGLRAKDGDASVKQILARAGIDRPVFYGGLAKVALATSNLVVILLVAMRLPGEVQGYYYTYLNLTALQVFAELGLGIVIVQMCSHLWSSLRLDEAGEVQGDAGPLARLVSL